MYFCAWAITIESILCMFRDVGRLLNVRHWFIQILNIRIYKTSVCLQVIAGLNKKIYIEMYKTVKYVRTVSHNVKLKQTEPRASISKFLIKMYTLKDKDSNGTKLTCKHRYLYIIQLANKRTVCNLYWYYSYSDPSRSVSGRKITQ